jgi:hypothetical protein
MIGKVHNEIGDCSLFFRIANIVAALKRKNLPTFSG